MRSRLFNLNLRDFLKGLLYAILAAILTVIQSALTAGALFETATWATVGTVALSTFLAYLGANIFQNSQGKFLTRESKIKK